MPIIIKRYHNRKLYNTQTRRYITLEEIEALIKKQEDIQVIDNDSGSDITSTTLSQIIFGLEKNQSGIFPVDLLISLVRSGGKRFDDIRRNIFPSINFDHHFANELDKRINRLITSGDMSRDEGDQIFKKLITVEVQQEGLIDDMEEKISGFLNRQLIPSRTDLQTLMDRLDELSQAVETLSVTKPTPEEKDRKSQIIE